MADLPEIEIYDAGVYQLETTDPVIGGVDGKSNAAARNLSNRTKWLKARVDELKAETSMTDHVADADPHTHYATKVGLQTNAHNHAVAGGTANAITATYTPAYTAWADGMTFSVEITAANTSATPTVSPNGLAVKTIVKGAGTALRIGDQVSGMIAEYKYSATLDQVILQNPITGNAGLIASNIQIVTATGTIPASIAGGTLVINSASATTQTLPAASTFAAGKRIEFMSIGAGVATVSRAGSDLIKVNSATATSLPLSLGDTLTLESDGVDTWYAVGGTAQLKYAKAFYSSLAGYNNIQYLPSGLIIQTAIGVNQTAFAWQTITYPMAFPNAVHAAFVSTIASNTVPGNATATWSVSSSIGIASCQVIKSNTDASIGITPLLLVIGR